MRSSGRGLVTNTTRYVECGCDATIDVVIRSSRVSEPTRLSGTCRGGRASINKNNNPRETKERQQQQSSFCLSLGFYCLTMLRHDNDIRTGEYNRYAKADRAGEIKTKVRGFTRALLQFRFSKDSATESWL